MKEEKLIWSPEAGPMTWEEARDYAVSLTLDGRKWRLPSIDEILTQYDFICSKPKDGWRRIGYWTSRQYKDNSALALSFFNVEQLLVYKTDNFYIKCVAEETERRNEEPEKEVPTGWICPVCGIALSPAVLYCKHDFIITSGGTK